MSLKLSRSHQLLDEKELVLDGKNKNHRRKQKISDASNWMFSIGLLLASALVFVLAVCYTYHILTVRDWETVRLVVVASAMYLIGYLKKNGVIDTKE